MYVCTCLVSIVEIHPLGGTASVGIFYSYHFSHPLGFLLLVI